MPTKFTGGCLCGRVRYECSADPFFMANCHCRKRRRVRTRHRIAGRGAEGYGRGQVLRQESGQRQYAQPCLFPECGSSLFGKTSAMPDLAMITAGSLDDPSLYKPTLDIFTSSAQPWDHMNPVLAKFPKMPPMES